MYHKISEMCDVVNVMYEKSMQLRREKYDLPKESQNPHLIQSLIDDIQSLALQIANDKGEYVKR